MKSLSYYSARSRFADVDTLWRTALDVILEDGQPTGSRDGACRELLGYTATLDDPERTFLCDPTRALDPTYAAAEVLWYLEGTTSVARLKPFAPSYQQRWAPTGYTNGAYGPRIMRQLPDLVHLLLKKPSTRQASITVLDGHDLAVSANYEPLDTPCAMSLTFTLRDGLLWAHGVMRSNDLWIGFPYDVFAFTFLQRVVAAMIDAKPGPYVHTAVNLHLYDKHLARAKECQAQSVQPTRPHGWGDYCLGGSPQHLIRQALSFKVRQLFDTRLLGFEGWPPLCDMLALTEFGQLDLLPKSPALVDALRRKLAQRGETRNGGH